MIDNKKLSDTIDKIVEMLIDLKFESNGQESEEAVADNHDKDISGKEISDEDIDASADLLNTLNSNDFCIVINKMSDTQISFGDNSKASAFYSDNRFINMDSCFVKDIFDRFDGADIVVVGGKLVVDSIMYSVCFYRSLGDDTVMLESYEDVIRVELDSVDFSSVGMVGLNYDAYEVEDDAQIFVRKIKEALISFREKHND